MATDFAKKVNTYSPFQSSVWNFKPEKIKRKTLTDPIAKGCLNMVNFVNAEKSLKGAPWTNGYNKSQAPQAL